MPGKSCVTQLLYVMELWTESLDQGNPVDVIYFKPLTLSHTLVCYSSFKPMVLGAI